MAKNIHELLLPALERLQKLREISRWLQSRIRRHVPTRTLHVMSLKDSFLFYYCAPHKTVKRHLLSNHAEYPPFSRLLVSPLLHFTPPPLGLCLPKCYLKSLDRLYFEGDSCDSSFWLPVVFGCQRNFSKVSSLLNLLWNFFPLNTTELIFAKLYFIFGDFCLVLRIPCGAEYSIKVAVCSIVL